jgi:hypothetical protein
VSVGGKPATLGAYAPARGFCPKMFTACVSRLFPFSFFPHKAPHSRAQVLCVCGVLVLSIRIFRATLLNLGTCSGSLHSYNASFRLKL